MPSCESYSYSSIEGDWKNFRFRRILPKDYESVYEHVGATFVKDEPTCKLLGYSKEFADDFNKLMAKMLKDNLSFLAEDRETGEIAGVRISFKHTKETTFDDIQVISHQLQTLIKLIHDVEGLTNVPEKLGVDTWAEFFVASTTPKYRNQGLAGEFYNRSISFFKDNGFKHAMVLVSSPFTRAATEKQGFVELCRLDYKTLTGLDGKPAFKAEELGPEHFICLRVKNIE